MGEIELEEGKMGEGEQWEKRGKKENEERREGSGGRGGKTTPISVKGTGSLKEQRQDGGPVPKNLKLPTEDILGGCGGRDTQDQSL